MSAASNHDLIAVSSAEASRNLGLVAHYAGIVADALAVGNVEIVLAGYRSLVLHVRLAGVDVRAIGEASIAGAGVAADGLRDGSGVSHTPQPSRPVLRQSEAIGGVSA
jgi:hypothetical protein